MGKTSQLAKLNFKEDEADTCYRKDVSYVPAATAEYPTPIAWFTVIPARVVQ